MRDDLLMHSFHAEPVVAECDYCRQTADGARHKIGPFGSYDPVAVYVAYCSASRRIKIGRTVQGASERIGRIQSPSRLILLAALYASEDLESDLHSHFKAERVHGEWFSLNRRVRFFLRELARRGRTHVWPSLPLRDQLPADHDARRPDYLGRDPSPSLIRRRAARRRAGLT